ncbi:MULTISPECIES: hypothetical protein [unclassified Gemella]|uniref:hypothetical protein n=1 Tax=unclassified Gemella TaxID=2624949 RepID=UPI001073A8E8|nr:MULTISPECIES: hypothetical protein [unclassified Gemella]MBF0710264.1 hypothetical protein [Gemella sp. GL1.1]MBF0746308.1 hypothetical protein [Gemella sp. 19428wG2_WT2a]NYS27608.1 hypothetical protein [Gemella sp. GL1]TFU60584.1 hypothetical protein E4T67_01255 [Gemella sp. WT2a]
MNFLFVAIPVIVVLVGLIFVIVMFSDSNKHVNNMDTARQLELERNKEAALEEVRKLKNREFTLEENSNEMDDLNSKVNTQAEEIEKLRAELEELRKNSQKKEISNIVENKSILNFSKTNIVKGLITKEYLEKKGRG